MAGSKPQALHTEFAQDGDYDGAYHGEIVFYLRRADGGSSEANKFEDSMTRSGNLVWDESSANLKPPGEADPGFESSESVWNQVGAGKSVGTPPEGGQAGMGTPPSGRSAPLGKLSQNTGNFQEVGDSLRNIFQSVKSFDKTERHFSLSSSEHFFNEALDEAFNPETERDILSTFDRGCRSDLAVQLARATGGVTSTEDLVEGINQGAFGLTTQKSRALGALTTKTQGRSHRSYR